MSNTSLLSSSFYISPWNTLEISGEDSQDLLNRLLTLDVKNLKNGQGSWAFLLDHRGQIIESIWLLKVTSERWLAVSESDTVNLHQSLDHFVFSERVEFLPLPNHSCVYLLSTEHEPHTLTSQKDWTTIPLQMFQDLTHHESLCILPNCDLELLRIALNEQGVHSLETEEFEHLRISLGGSLPSKEYRSGTPLDVARKGISEGKGCYPGQEVIERTIALGKPSRHTVKVVIHLLASEYNSSLKVAYQQGARLTIYPALLNSAAVGELTSLSISSFTSHSEERFSMIGIAKLKSKIVLDDTPWMGAIRIDNAQDIEIQPISVSIIARS